MQIYIDIDIYKYVYKRIYMFTCFTNQMLANFIVSEVFQQRSAKVLYLAILQLNFHKLTDESYKEQVRKQQLPHLL